MKKKRKGESTLSWVIARISNKNSLDGVKTRIEFFENELENLNYLLST
jgi:hypothetical protein